MNKLQSRAVKVLGADITDAGLQQTLYNLGINESVSTMTQAEKTIVRYLALQEQLKDAEGDTANTINSVSNQTKVFKEQIAIAGRQLGGFFIPVLKTLLKYVNAILMVFNTLTEMLMEFFGIDAVSLADEFGTGNSDAINEITESLNAMSDSANSAKKSLRGFDKLNNITTSSSSSSGGLGGISSEILEAMENYNLGTILSDATAIKEEIMQWLGFSKDVNGEWEWSGGTLLKNIWNWWKKLNIVAKTFVTIGAAVAIAKIVTAFKNLWSLIKGSKIYNALSLIVDTLGRKGLAGTLAEINSAYGGFAQFFEVLIGIVAIVDGIVKLGDALKAVADGTATLGDYLDILWSVLEVISGIAIVVGAFGDGKVLAAGIVGLGIAIGGQLLTNTIATADATEKWATALWDLSDAQQSNIDEADSYSARAQILVDDLGKLYDSNGNLIGSYDDAATKVSALNELLGTEYTLNEDGTIMLGNKKVAYDDLSKSVDEYCKKLRAEAYIEAFRENYISAIKKQNEKQQEYDALLKEINDDQKNYDTTTKEGTIQWLKDNQSKIDKLNELDSQLATNQQNISNYEKASYEASTGNYDNAMTLINSTAETITKSYDSTVQDIINKSGTISAEVQQQIHEIDGMNASITIKAVLDSSKYKSDLNGLKEYSSKYGISTSTTGYVSTYSAKAEGGFVNTGELFVAREAGPEFVGTIGGKSAVANNDQIVEAISIGVAKANMATQKDTNVVIEATGDTQGLMNFISFNQKSRERQYGL